jgi:hypothetical protein
MPAEITIDDVISAIKEDQRRHRIAIAAVAVCALAFLGMFLNSQEKLKTAEADTRLANAELGAKAGYARGLADTIDGLEADIVVLSAEIAEMDAEVESLK